MELSNFEIWEKWFILLGGFFVIIFTGLKWDGNKNKENEFLDVPDFIKGNIEDFIGKD